jgi:RNA polymerase sigma factor (sigma-70 family)
MKTKSCSGACTEWIRASSARNGIDEREFDRRAEQEDLCRSFSSWRDELPRSEFLPEILEQARTVTGAREILKADVAPLNGAGSRNMKLSAASAYGSVLDGSRVPMVCGNGADMLIVVVLAENSCRCAGFDQDGSQDRRSRRITIDGRSVSPTIIQTLRVGGSDTTGTQGDELLASVARALERHEQSKQPAPLDNDVTTAFASLTARQREIMDLVLAGHPNKFIAADLGISQRTVENHRASIMKKTGAKSLAALVRLAMIAERAAQATRTAQH